MGHNINDKIDERTVERDHKPRSERFREECLEDMPKAMWPSYINEIVRDVVFSEVIITGGGDDIIRNKNEAANSIGGSYREGLQQISDQIDNDVDDDVIGDIAVELAKIEKQIEDESIGKVDIIRAAIDKELSEKSITTIATTSDELQSILIDILSDETLYESVYETLYSTSAENLVELVDSPYLSTLLWEHQQEALQNWITAGGSGYVNMATATGKTVLGVSTIAYKYGELRDEDTENLPASDEINGKTDVLIVANNKLLLNQWRDEMDKHLTIPKERVSFSDTDSASVELSWGTLHFRTDSALKSSNNHYDLVILDEAHHYTNSINSITDSLSYDNIIALSGSIGNSASERTQTTSALEESIGECILEYSLSEAKQDGVIPEFNWENTFVPIEDESDLRKLTQDCKEGFKKINKETDNNFTTYKEVRNFFRTTEGRELKKSRSTSDGEQDWKEIASSFNARKTTIWNCKPVESEVVELATNYDDKKTVIILNTYSQVDSIYRKLEDGNDEVLKIDAENADSTITKFKTQDNPTLIGVNKLIGEGIDLPDAEVAISTSKAGGVNTSLIQNMGRVLRQSPNKANPEFHNIIPIQKSGTATAIEGDSPRLITQLSKLYSYGKQVKEMPEITAHDEVETNIDKLESDGFELLIETEESHPELYSEFEENETLVTNPDWPMQEENTSTTEKTVTGSTYELFEQQGMEPLPSTNLFKVEKDGRIFEVAEHTNKTIDGDFLLENYAQLNVPTLLVAEAFTAGAHKFEETEDNIQLLELSELETETKKHENRETLLSHVLPQTLRDLIKDDPSNPLVWRELGNRLGLTYDINDDTRKLHINDEDYAIRLETEEPIGSPEIVVRTSERDLETEPEKEISLQELYKLVVLTDHYGMTAQTVNQLFSYGTVTTENIDFTIE